MPTLTYSADDFAHPTNLASAVTHKQTLAQKRKFRRDKRGHDGRSIRWVKPNNDESEIAIGEALFT